MVDPVASALLTLNAYTRAINDLPVEQVYAELTRLDKSEHRLRDTNAQLRLEEPCLEFQEAIVENEVLLEAYVGRRQAIHDDLRNRGAMIPPVQTTGARGAQPVQVQTSDRSNDQSQGQGVFL
ncbi:hypothetical protein BCR37DRAFT_107415 [Protomyces lactucae-debilis]|uniref:Uncharacterized protein n=1 Tax=Protomyces lactucae-debilis TaxID=2754530 RepID=A0A1Y2F3V1_PROLT|nr:uncharacterized protein BCR37DRAFT_107415 [Protomyces lactucae-debilis]ORY78549.1 hypothetical protein BCR37DRAFT_107415 [Protomyces lactucae-debilis]